MPGTNFMLRREDLMNGMKMTSARAALATVAVVAAGSAAAVPGLSKQVALTETVLGRFW